MTKTPFVSFKDIKKAVSMVQVLEHYGLMQTLSPRGEDALTGPCPVHQGTNPTQFRVSLSKNCWNCFGECPGGNVLDFVAQMEKTDIRGAAVLLAQWFGLDGKGGAAPKEQSPAPSSPEPTQEIHEKAAPSAPSPEAPSEPTANTPLPFPGLKHLDPEHDYLVKRGFGRATMEHFGVGFCQKGMMRGRIAIPIHNAKGELLAYAGRSTAEGGPVEDLYKYPPNFRKDLEVYNLNRAVWSSRLGTEGLVLVSDFFDVFRLYQAGYDNAVALMGTDLSDRQHRLLLTVLGESAKITLLLRRETPETVEIISKLFGTFFVRLVRTQVCPADLPSDHLPELLSGESVRGPP